MAAAASAPGTANLNTAVTGPQRGTPEDWRVLLALALYRLLLIALLLTLEQSGYSQLLFDDILLRRFHWTCVGYAIIALLMIPPAIYRWPRLEVQSHLQFAVDVLAIGALMYTTGGVSAGLGVLLMLPAVGCALLVSPRMAVVQAAAATLAMFGEEIIRQSGIGFDASEFARAGLLGLMFFAISGTASYVSLRARRSEQLAERVGSEFADLSRVNERIIETLSTGLVVIDGKRRIRIVNAAAQHLLALTRPEGRLLSDASPPLHAALERWLAGDPWQSGALAPHGDLPDVLPRFSRLGSGATTPIMILLDDASALRAQAQQLKMAALGRLSASIAHEIRNPLSAITHASQLLAESPELGGENQRLLGMVQRHGARIEKIVRDVLELSRRDAAPREHIRLRAWLLRTVALYQEGYSAQPRPIELLDVPADLTASCGASHLQQILFNLWDNSFEHGAEHGGSVVLVNAGTDAAGQPFLETADNGPGIAPELHERIFEPFFTTSARGTGLGLYLARELCEYNRARLTYLPLERGACFRITFARETS
jgi:two-component system, NtrC family, sensor histidine kinase PilS